MSDNDNGSAGSTNGSSGKTEKAKEKAKEMLGGAATWASNNPKKTAVLLFLTGGVFGYAIGRYSSNTPAVATAYAE